MKKIFAFILALATLSITASAEVKTDVSSTLGSLVIKASINLGPENAYKPVSINVVNNSSRKTVFFDAAIADENGKYTFEFVNTGATGTYRINFTSPDTYSGYMQLTGFKGQAYYKEYIDAINNNLDNPTVLKDSVEAYLGLVSWDLTKYNDISDKTVFYKIFGLMRDSYSYIDLLEIKDDFEFVTRIAYDIEKKDTDDILLIYAEDKENNKYGFRDSIPAGKTDTFLDDLRESVKLKALTNTLNGNIVSKQSVCDLLTFNILKTSIKDAEHYEDVKNAICAYKSKYLPNAKTNSDYIVEACKDMMGNDYSTYQQIENAFNTFINAYENKKNADLQRQPVGGGVVISGGAGAVSTVKTEPDFEADVKENISIMNNNEPQMIFSDMEDAKWALSAVNSLTQMGIINGMGDGTFAPHKAVSRAEFAQMAVTLGGFSAKSNTAFVDVADDAWYANAVKAAKDNNIFSGNIDGTFRPNQEITREQLALVVYRMLIDRAEIPEFEEGTFADDAEIDFAYRYAVYALKSIGVMKGRSDKSFCPNETVTRVEAAVVLNNICKYF